MPAPLKLTYLGRHHEASGDLFYMTHANGNKARVFVDSLGETWVDIRRIPADGFFHSERVDAWRALNGSTDAERILREQGFDAKRTALYAHRVRELV